MTQLGKTQTSQQRLRAAKECKKLDGKLLHVGRGRVALGWDTGRKLLEVLTRFYFLTKVCLTCNFLSFMCILHAFSAFTFYFTIKIFEKIKKKKKMALAKSLRPVNVSHCMAMGIYMCK